MEFVFCDLHKNVEGCSLRWDTVIVYVFWFGKSFLLCPSVFLCPSCPSFLSRCCVIYSVSCFTVPLISGHCAPLWCFSTSWTVLIVSTCDFYLLPPSSILCLSILCSVLFVFASCILSVSCVFFPCFWMFFGLRTLDICLYLLGLFASVLDCVPGFNCLLPHNPMSLVPFWVVS